MVGGPTNYKLKMRQEREVRHNSCFLLFRSGEDGLFLGGFPRTSLFSRRALKRSCAEGLPCQLWHANHFGLMVAQPQLGLPGRFSRAGSP